MAAKPSPTTVGKLKEQLTCAICLELYDNPRTLPCHHSFCLQCLKRLPQDIRGGFIACPTCRRRIKLPPEPEEAAAFPAAFHLVTLMEAYTQMIKPPDQQQSCSNHEKPFEIYCETCQKVICIQCTRQVHKYHEWELISDCYPKHHQELEGSLEALKVKMDAIKNILTVIIDREDQIGKQNEKIKHDIYETEEEARHVLHESTQQLIREVETVTDDKLRVLSEQKQTAELILCRLMASKEYVEHEILKYNQLQLLMSKRNMMELMSQIIQQIKVEEHTPIEKANIEMIKDNKVVKAAHHVGDITFTSLQQCKVSRITEMKHLLKENSFSFLLSLESPDCSLVTVPASSINCALVSLRPSCQPIVAEVTNSCNPEVYNVHCKPLTHGQHQVNVQVHNVHLRSTTLLIPFNPYFNVITPIRSLDKLDHSWGVTVSDDGSHVVVTEGFGQCVSVLDGEGKKMKSFGGKEASNDLAFSSPRGVVIIKDNCILVADDHKIQKITMNGEYIASIGLEGNGRFQFNTPAGMAISPKTELIYIVDSGNHRIQVLTQDLTFPFLFGGFGSAEGQFHFPRDIAIDSRGLLYVTDSGNHRIQVLTPEGQFVTKFGTKGFGPGQIASPGGITIDRSNDLVYITEEANQRISVFTSEGQFVNCYGKKNKLFSNPRGIKYFKGQLYICEFDKSNLIIV